MEIEEISEMCGWDSESEKIRNLKIACSSHARAALIKGKPETIVQAKTILMDLFVPSTSYQI